MSAQTLHEFALYSSHKASNGFLVVLKDLEAWIRMLYKFRQR